MSRRKVAILISGRGSNMAALIDAAASPDYPAEIVLVVSNRADARGIAIAAAKGIATAIVPSKGMDRDAHDAEIGKALEASGAEIVCLAGYLRLLTPSFVAKWQGRMINIHPALLPLFKGLDTHRRAIEAGMRIHGCSVHFVTPEMDDGPIIAQAAVPVLLDDDEESLGNRVLAAEHALYPAALALVARGHVRLEEGRALFADLADATDRGQRVIAPSIHHDETPDLESLARFTP